MEHSYIYQNDMFWGHVEQKWEVIELQKRNMAINHAMIHMKFQ